MGSQYCCPAQLANSVYLLCVASVKCSGKRAKKANKTLNTLRFFQNKTGNDRTRTSSWGQEWGRNIGFAAREEEQGATDLGSFILHLISSKYKLPPNTQLHLPSSMNSSWAATRCHWVLPELSWYDECTTPGSPHPRPWAPGLSL